MIMLQPVDGEPRRADPLLDHRPASRRGRRLVGERSGSRVARAVKWLGWDDAMRRAQLQGVVCNSRFLILRVYFPRAGSNADAN
jgi:hypothetical protein